MADNVTLDPGSGGAVIAADDITGVWHQRVKIQHGADGSATDVSSASPLPVIAASNSGVDIGDVTVNNGVGASAVPIQDGGNSITVDGTVAISGTVTVDASGTAVPVTDNGGTLSIDDGGGAITVDGAVSVTGSVDTELTTGDLDTGAGTDTRAVVGLVGSADGGGQLIPGSATHGLLVNLGANNDVTVTGTIDLGATDNAVLDAIDTDLTTIIGHVDGLEGLLTTIDADTSTLAAVDFATGADVASLGVTGGGVEATALRVTLASDSTGVVSVDDNGSTLSIDDGGGAITVDGTVTVNAGTNLNTSALALESGGNLAGAATSLAVIDDWDQSDRAKVNAQEVSGVMIENAVDVTVKYAVIDAATSGDNTLVAAVTNKKIRVLSVFLVAAGTVNVRFESGASGTALTGQMNLIANTGFVLPYNPHGWFQSAESTLLNLELSGAISVDGALTYIEAE